MGKKQKLLLLLAMALVLLAVPAIAQANGMPEMQHEALDLPHILSMALLFIVSLAIIALNLKAVGTYGGLMGAAFKIIAAGMAVLAVGEVMQISSHLGYITWSPFSGHAMNIVAFAIIAYGFWKIIDVGKGK